MSTPQAPTTAAFRLVVVDDDPGIRTLLEVVASFDPRFDLVGAAASGKATLDLLREQERHGAIDLVLLDVTLPDRDGIELVSDVREVASSARVAVFTGWSDPGTIRRAHEAGADAIFSKGGDPQQLLDSLAALVS